MQVIKVGLVFVAALHITQRLFLGGLVLALPFGAIVTTSGIIGFKICLGASLLSFIGRGLSGSYGLDVRAGNRILAVLPHDRYVSLSGRNGLLEPPPTTVTTTQEPVEPTVRTPVSALQNILR